MNWNDELDQIRAEDNGNIYWVYKNSFKFSDKWKVYVRKTEESKWRTLDQWFETKEEALNVAEKFNSSLVKEDA